MSDNEFSGADIDFEETSFRPQHRALRSVVWDHFTVIDRKNQIASCNVCERRLSYRTTVTNLKKHVIRKHPHGGLSEDNVPPRASVSARKRIPVSDIRRTTTKDEYHHREVKPFDIRKTKLTDLGGLEGLVLNIVGEDGVVSENEGNEEQNYNNTEEVHDQTATDDNQVENSPRKEYRGSRSHQMDPSEKKRRGRIMDLQLECLEIKKYNMQLESLMLERQLNMCRSIFSEPLRHADTISKGIQTDVGGEKTRVFYLSDRKGGVPKRHLIALEHDSD